MNAKRNPDGTRTRAEHQRQILLRVQAHIRAGKTPEEAVTLGSAEWQASLKAEGDRKLAQVRKFLGLKEDA